MEEKTDEDVDDFVTAPKTEEEEDIVVEIMCSFVNDVIDDIESSDIISLNTCVSVLFLNKGDSACVFRLLVFVALSSSTS